MLSLVLARSLGVICNGNPQIRVESFFTPTNMLPLAVAKNSLAALMNSSYHNRLWLQRHLSAHQSSSPLLPSFPPSFFSLSTGSTGHKRRSFFCEETLRCTGCVRGGRSCLEENIPRTHSRCLCEDGRGCVCVRAWGGPLNLPSAPIIIERGGRRRGEGGVWRWILEAVSLLWELPEGARLGLDEHSLPLWLREALHGGDDEDN